MIFRLAGVHLLFLILNLCMKPNFVVLDFYYFVDRYFMSAKLYLPPFENVLEFRSSFQILLFLRVKNILSDGKTGSIYISLRIDSTNSYSHGLKLNVFS